MKTNLFIRVYQGGTLNFEGGEVSSIYIGDNTHAGGTVNNMIGVGYSNSTHLGGVLTVSGGTVNAVVDVYSGNATVSGGTVTGMSVLQNGIASVSGGTVTTLYVGTTSGGGISGGVLTVSGGTVGTLGVKHVVGSATLTGGSFNSIENVSGRIVGDLLGTGYSFQDGSNNPVCASGTSLTASTEDTPYTVVSGHTCTWGTTGACSTCGKQAAALVTNGSNTAYWEALTSDSFTSGDTVQLLKNVQLTTIMSVTVPATLDLNGHTIYSPASQGKVQINSGGSLTIKDTTTDPTKMGSFAAPVTVSSGGTLTVDSAVTLDRISVESGGSITVNADSKFLSLSITGGTAVLNSGTFSTLKVGTGETLSDKIEKGKLTLGAGKALRQTSDDRKWLTDLGEESLSKVSVQKTPIKGRVVISSTNKNTTYTGINSVPYTYGDSETFTATVTLAEGYTSADAAYAWSNDGGNLPTTGCTANGATLSVTFPTAGDYNFNCSVTVDGYTATAAFGGQCVVNKATLTADQYSAPTAKTGLTYTGSEQQLLSAAGTCPEGATKHYSLDKTNWKTSISEIQDKDAKTYTVYWYIEGGTNYNDVTDTRPVTVTIAPKDISVETPTYIKVGTSPLTYTGQPQTPTFTVKLMPKDSGTATEYETLVKDRDYTVTVTPQTNAGDSYPATLTGKGNYTGTKNTDWSISKADYGSQTAAGSAKYGAAGTVELSTLIMPGGTASYQSKTDNNAVLSGEPDMTGTKLQFAFANDSAKIGQTAEITVSVTGCTNYNDYTITVTVTVADKDVPTVSANNITKVYNSEAIPTTAITGTATFGGQTVVGSWSFTNAAPTTVADSSDSVSVTFTPDDTTNFNAATTTIKVTITKATPTGAPSYTAITENGKTLADAALDVGTITPAGAVKWVDADGSPLVGTTEVIANTAYKWLFTPTDSNNYNTLSGSITLYPVFTGGGTTTVTVPVSSDKGTVNVKAEVSQEGTATVEISDKQIETVIADGAGTVTVDVSGLKDVESVQVPSHVVETTNKAADTGLTVALPGGSVSLDETALESVTDNADGKDVTVSVKEVPATDLTEAQQKAVGDMANIGLVVDVDLLVGGEKQSAFNGGKLTISVPYTPKRGEDVSRLTVWFIRDDGTIENKGGYYDAAKGCFVFETGHLSRYLLVSVNVSFSDVSADAYYAAAVNWAVARNITEGIGGGLFGPDRTCTRAEIVTLLWRAAGSPESTDAADFSDVSAEAYYAKAVAWAVENGITEGVGGGKFAPDATCNRAQAVTFLYRMEQAQGGGFTGAWMFRLPFTDVPEWCYEAVAWCSMNGITNGVGGDRFGADIDCTRAQIVTMLYRLLGK